MFKTRAAWIWLAMALGMVLAVVAPGVQTGPRNAVPGHSEATHTVDPSFFAVRGRNKPAESPPVKNGLPVGTKPAQPATKPGQDETGTPFTSHNCESVRVLELANPPLVGDDIREYQTALLMLGFSPGTLDGMYGESTAAAVREFQRSRHMQPNGKIDVQTQALLAGAFEPGNATPPVLSDRQEKPQGSARILIDLHTHRLVVLVDGKPFQIFPVAVGKRESRSPMGEFSVVSKGAWGNGFGTRWMQISVPWGTYGIHGTNKPWTIGSAASGGCFRMYNQHVEQVFDMVQVGTPVDVVGDFFLLTKTIPGLHKKGDRSQWVVVIQQRLRQLGYLSMAKRTDGTFDDATEMALKLFQEMHHLPEDGKVAGETKRLLGLGG